MSSFIFFACSVCGGDPHSNLSKGALAGVFFLGGVVICVLASILATGIVWVRRARKLNSEF